MGALGKDIKEVFKEIGISYDVLRGGAVLSTEYLEPRTVKYNSRTFLSEHLFYAGLPFDTQVKTGDTVRFGTTGEIYLVMQNEPDIFEDEILTYRAMLYKSNAVATFSRASDAGRDENTYHKNEGFVPYATNVSCIVADQTTGGEIIDSQAFGNYEKKNLLLYVSGTVGIQELDRITITSTEKYKLEQVIVRLFDGNTHYCLLTEDTRGD